MNSENLIKKLSKQGAKKPLPKMLKSIILSCCFLLLYSLLALFAFGLRDDFLQRITEFSFQIEVFLIILTIILADIAVNFLRLPDEAQRPIVKFAPIISFFILLAYICFLKPEESSLLVPCNLDGCNCMISILIFSALPAIFLFIFLNYGVSANPYFSALVIGVASGNISYLTSLLNHETNDLQHIILWHFMPNFLVIAICLLIMKFILSFKK